MAKINTLELDIIIFLNIAGICLKNRVSTLTPSNLIQDTQSTDKWSYHNAWIRK